MKSTGGGRGQYKAASGDLHRYIAKEFLAEAGNADSSCGIGGSSAGRRGKHISLELQQSKEERLKEGDIGKEDNESKGGGTGQLRMVQETCPPQS